MRILVRRPGEPNMCPNGIVDPLCATEAVGVHRGRAVLYDSVSRKIIEVKENGAHLLQIGAVVALPEDVVFSGQNENAQVSSIGLEFRLSPDGVIDCETHYNLERAV